MTILTDSESEGGAERGAGRLQAAAAEMAPAKADRKQADEPGPSEKDLALTSVRESQRRRDDVDREVEKKNNYKHSANALAGDLPKVFAFEVESNIRRVLADILRPVMENVQRVNVNIADLSACFTEVTSSITRVNRRMDKELTLEDRVNDANQRTNKLRQDWDLDSTQVQKKLAELTQLYKVHEDKLARYNDEKARLTQSRDQLRADIREFEKLVQEVANMSKTQAMEVREEYTGQIAKIRLQVDEIMFDHRATRDYIRVQKPRVAQLDAQIDMVKRTLKDHQISLFKLDNLEKVVAENERFLGYVLPLRIQEVVHKSLLPLHKGDRELGISLLENSEERMKALSESMHAVDQKTREMKPTGRQPDGEAADAHVVMATFDKHSVVMPPFQ